MNCYQTLGLKRDARLGEIKKAYRKLARKYHPDLNPADKRADDRFKKITGAYEILSDPKRRQAYDRELALGEAWHARGAGRAPGATTWDFDSGFGPSGPAGFAPFFSEILGGLGVERGDPRSRHAGSDVTHAISISFSEAMTGLTTTLSLDAESSCPPCNGSGTVPSKTQRPCPDCAGTGRISLSSGLLRFASTCRRCHGEGKLGADGCGACAGTGVRKRRETIRVHIPAGVDHGSRVRIPGRGRAGRNGGPPGDLYIVTQVAPHPYFRRIGDNIYCSVPITVTEAALGTRIEVPTIDGVARIRIPPGTENGQKFRLRGKGVSSLRGTVRGDHYVEAQVRTSSNTDERARQLLRELGKLEPGDEIRRAYFG